MGLAPVMWAILEPMVSIQLPAWTFYLLSGETSKQGRYRSRDREGLQTGERSRLGGVQTEKGSRQGRDPDRGGFQEGERLR